MTGRRWQRAWVVVIAAVCLAWPLPAQDMSMDIPLAENAQMKGFRLPMYDDENVMTSQLFGELAKVLPDGNVEITGLKMEFYTYIGDERITEMTVTSPLCYYNRDRGVVVSESDVRISRREMIVTGRGFRYSNDKQELKILNDSKVVLRGASKQDGLEVTK